MSVFPKDFKVTISKFEDHDGLDLEPISSADEGDLIWVTSFDEEKAREFSDKLFKQAKADAKKPIVIYIDSYGGSVDGMATMFSAMDSVKNKLITVCMGKAMSAGAMLLSHGDVRYAHPHSRMMVHEISAGAWGNINDLKTQTAEMDRLNDYWMGILAQNVGMTRKQLKKHFTNKHRDIYLTPQQAVDFGLIDKIGAPQVKKTARYELID